MRRKVQVTKKRSTVPGIITGETILEIAWPDGSGCLVSARNTAEGQPVLEIYRADPQINVLDGRADSTYATERQWVDKDGVRGRWEVVLMADSNDRNIAKESFRKLKSTENAPGVAGYAYRWVETSHRVLEI